MGTETAEYLLEKGCTVSFIEMMDKIANGESSALLPTILAGFKKHDVKQYANTKVSAIEQDDKLVRAVAGDQEVTIACDMVVMAVGSVKNLLDLDGVTVSVVYAGAANAPRALWKPSEAAIRQQMPFDPMIIFENGSSLLRRLLLFYGKQGRNGDTPGINLTYDDIMCIINI